MRHFSLLKFSQNFHYKVAGLLKVPEDTLKEIQDWALSVYFSNAIKLLLNKKDEMLKMNISSSNLNKLIVECKSYIKNENDAYFNDKRFEIKLPEFNDKILFVEAQFLFHKEKLKSQIGITGFSGLWSKQKNFGNIDVVGNVVGKIFIVHELEMPSSSEEIEKIVFDIKMTVRHELQHAVQTIIANSKKIKEQDLINKKIKNKSIMKEYDDHIHQNIEFYTNLTDSIEEFKQIRFKLPEMFHRILFELWIAAITPKKFFDFVKQNIKQIQDVSVQVETMETIEEHTKNDNTSVIGKNYLMFFQIKNKEPEKYKKAVKEFYKAIKV